MEYISLDELNQKLKNVPKDIIIVSYITILNTEATQTLIY
jgi:hypothetical protein